MTDADRNAAAVLAAARCIQLNISAPEDMLRECEGMIGLMEARQMLSEAAGKNARAPRSDEDEEPEVIAMNGGTDMSILNRMFGHR